MGNSEIKLRLKGNFKRLILCDKSKEIRPNNSNFNHEYEKIRIMNLKADGQNGSPLSMHIFFI